MSCSVCGSNVPCNCNYGPNLVQDPAACCNPTPSGCCQNVVVPAPTPFYNCAPACPENHTQKIVIQSFRADVKIVDSWNVPACDLSAVVNTESLNAIVVGSYLWNPTYGYFLITAFNSGTGQITLLNPCVTGNASPGTQIPACTEFTVTVPPCDCTNDSQVCVAIDFTAPDVGDCIDITLTNTTGILVGNVIQIGTGQYRVSALKPNDIITICNDGDGITPGTSVIAKDAQGNYQYCIQVVASNPCDADVITTGKVLACDGGGIISPLGGATAGQVLTLVDATLETASYQDNVPDCCADLQDEIDDLPFYNTSRLYQDSPAATIDTAGTTSWAGTHHSFTITNPSATKNMRTSIAFDLLVNSTVAGDLVSSSYLAVMYGLNYTIDGGSPTSPGVTVTSTFAAPGAGDTFDQGAAIPWVETFVLTPGQTITVDMWASASVATQPAGGGGICIIDAISIMANPVGLPA